MDDGDRPAAPVFRAGAIRLRERVIQQRLAAKHGLRNHRVPPKVLEWRDFRIEPFASPWIMLQDVRSIRARFWWRTLVIK